MSTQINEVVTIKTTSWKTKLFTLGLFALLILPVLLVVPQPYSTGQVKGVIEEKPSPVTYQTNNAPKLSNQTKKVQETFIPKQGQLGEIGSGIQDVKYPTTKTEIDNVTGKIVWDENAKSSVATDKFPLGNGIKVKIKDKKFDLVVSDQRVLAADTVLVVDKTTFLRLGGNPETQDYIPSTNITNER